MKKTWILILSVCLLLGVLLGGLSAASEGEHPITLSVTVAPETQLEEGGTVEFLTFSIVNRGDAEYTLTNARLSGGYDGSERTLSGDITVLPGSNKEFTLYDVPVADDQLGKDVVYTLRWEEVRFEASTADPESDEESGEPVRTVTERSTTVSVRIDRFVAPELTITVSSDFAYVDEGNTFTITYRIANETQFDMTSLKLIDPGVSTSAIQLPGTDLMAGASITVPVEYTMGDEDMTFRPVASYIAAHRQTETAALESVTVGSVVIGIRLDVQQYPANEEGTTFAITVVNTGNRAMTSLQLYDEIYTPIELAFDLGPQQQKVLTFTIPSAYAAELVRTVRFRVTGFDFFGDEYTYVDVNSYEVVPYVLSDAVRLNLFASVTNAFIDESGKLCGTVQIELRNYSDIRVKNVVLREETLFGTMQTYDELQRGETYFTITYQLDNVPSLSFSATAEDASGKSYTTESVTLSLDQLRAQATKTKEQTIIYYSNAFLKSLTDRITLSFRNVVSVVLLLVVICGTVCLALWILERRISAKLPRDSILSIRVPSASKPATHGAIDRVLEGSPAEQLGYSAPIKIRYGTATPASGSGKSSSVKPSGSSLPQTTNVPKRTLDKTAAFRRSPAAVQSEKPAAIAPKTAAPKTAKSSVRVTEVQPLAKRKPLRPNEQIRMGSGR